MAVMRVQRICVAKSGLAKDNIVNSFYFEQSSGALGPIGSVSSGFVCAELDMLFNTAVGGGNAVRFFLGELQMATQRVVYKCYDMDDPSPRAPFAQPVAQNVTPVIATTSIPSEVAVCCSYRGVNLSGTAPGRRRGRFFVGPLNNAAYTSHATNMHAIPATALMTALVVGANRMKDNLLLLADPWKWVVYSPTARGSGPAADGTTDVSEVWVDNEFDTQRRRGRVADTRITMTV